MDNKELIIILGDLKTSCEMHRMGTMQSTIDWIRHSKRIKALSLAIDDIRKNEGLKAFNKIRQEEYNKMCEELQELRKENKELKVSRNIWFNEELHKAHQSMEFRQTTIKCLTKELQALKERVDEGKITDIIKSNWMPTIEGLGMWHKRYDKMVKDLGKSLYKYLKGEK